MADQSTKHDIEVEDRAGYLELLRTNANYRRLWFGSSLSLLGDWFNLIALYTLVSTLTGSPLAIGVIFLAKMIPWALSAPIAGLIVDRYNRRRLMIGADLVRAVIVLGFLFIQEAAHVPLLYVLIAAQVVVGSVYVPAKSASIPNITAPRELLTANALSSATWSTMLAMGAALGGFVVELAGIEAVFILDSITYLWSAWFVYRTVIPQNTEGADDPLLRTAARKIWDGWTHIQAHPRVGRVATAKATWALAGGGLVYMLTLIGEQVSPGAIAAGIGVLFMARGIGTGIGPIIARGVFTNQSHWPIVLGTCISMSGLAYFVVGLVPWAPEGIALVTVIALIILSHASSGANWVLATVLLQKRTEDRYRGRVFATEWLLVMIAESISIGVASVLLEMGWLELEGAVRTFAAAQVVFGLMWLLIVVPKERAADEKDEAARNTDDSGTDASSASD